MNTFRKTNTAVAFKTLQECKDFICLRQFEASEKRCKGFLPTDVYLSWMDEAAEIYADQFKAPVKIVTVEEVEKEAYNRCYKMSEHSKLMYMQGFEDCAEWMRKQLTGI